MTLHVRTLADRPDLEPALEPLLAAGWPRFMRESPLDRAYWERLLREFPDYQVVLVDDEVGCSAPAIASRSGGRRPASAPPDGWDEVFAQGHGRRRRRSGADLSGRPRDHHGRRRARRGLSHLVLRDCATSPAGHGLADLVAPVRPSHKAAYPLTPIERYLAWTTPDGRPFDPWLRVHVRLGGEVLTVCAESMVITGTVAEWEEWTRMRYPDSGPYVVPGALVPVEIDRDRDQGRYAEPNVWVRHRIGGQPAEPGLFAAAP